MGGVHTMSNKNAMSISILIAYFWFSQSLPMKVHKPQSLTGVRNKAASTEKEKLSFEHCVIVFLVDIAYFDVGMRYDGKP